MVTGRVVVNVGCGPLEASALPGYFADWQRIRVDIDASVGPDIVADLTDLSPIRDASADAVWASHCVEHLFVHQVPTALAEFRRILRAGGFLCVLVPDLQRVAEYVAADKLHEPLYQSEAGPITPHDILFGLGNAVAAGHTAMAHRCGFTPGMMQRSFASAGFAEILMRRRAATLELVAVARVSPARDDAERSELMTALGL